MANPSNITKDDEDGFNTRFRIQKCMFVAQHLGLGKKYRYNLYLHGPYSPLLSQDYYKAANDEIADDGADPNFDRDAVLEIMANEDDWLELATTLVDLAEADESMTDPDLLVRRAAVVKHLYPKGRHRGCAFRICAPRHSRAFLISWCGRLTPNT